MARDRRTTRTIVERIGRDRFLQMLGIGEKSLARCLRENIFTASWYRAIHEELASLDEPGPPMRLFSFKRRRARR